MAELIHRTEVMGDEWYDTSIVRIDGKEEFREKPGYRNRHAIFTKDSEWGEVHVDEHNALDFPQGTLNHTALYVNEQTGIPQTAAKLGIVAIAFYGLYKFFKYFED